MVAFFLGNVNHFTFYIIFLYFACHLYPMVRNLIKVSVFSLKNDSTSSQWVFRGTVFSQILHQVHNAIWRISQVHRNIISSWRSLASLVIRTINIELAIPQKQTLKITWKSSFKHLAWTHLKHPSIGTNVFAISSILDG